MATTIKIYHDAAATSPVTGAAPIAHTPDAGAAATAIQLWAGSTDATIKHRRKTLPGVNQLQVSVADADSGAGLPVTDVKLSLTEAGLAGAVAGAALDLGVEILGGVANLVTFWVQVTDSVGNVASCNDLSLKILNAEDVPA